MCRTVRLTGRQNDFSSRNPHNRPFRILFPEVPPLMNKSTQLKTLIRSLFSRINYERRAKIPAGGFKLQHMLRLVERLGSPQLKYPIIHVAGTKGKGSVSTMVGQILTQQGYRTGVYVSPHLETLNQRISINGKSVSDEQLEQALIAVDSAARTIDEENIAAGGRPLTFFEVMTGTALQFFADQQVDFVVLEVGMGGRLDSTNVCNGTVSVITNISFDHTHQLGDTLAKIASEKAGIIKPGVPVISGVIPSEPAEVIAEVAARNQSPLAVLDQNFFVDWNPASGSTGGSLSQGTGFTVRGTIGAAEFQIDDIVTGMIGEHQRSNAAIAIAVCQQLNQLGWQIEPNAIREGLRRAHLPGRTEIVASHPAVMLDMAHNQASIIALAATLQSLPEFTASRNRILIFAISKDKDLPPMLNTIMGLFDTIVFTKFECNPRGREPDELLQTAMEQWSGGGHGVDESALQDTGFSDQTKGVQKQGVSGELARKPQMMALPNSQDAWKHVQSIATQDDFICIAGSAFLIADLRPVVTPEPIH